MKNTSALILVMLYLLAMARPVAPLFEYIIYEDYIAEFLCINKDNKELACNGKCYLMQQLAEKSEQKKQNLPKITIEEYPIGFVQLFDDTSDLSTPQTSNKGNHCYLNTYFYLYCSNSFHPPNSPA